MVREGVFSASRCYELVFIGLWWCEAGNWEMERPTAALLE
jgi:hypothetical protein